MPTALWETLANVAKRGACCKLGGHEKRDRCSGGTQRHLFRLFGRGLLGYYYWENIQEFKITELGRKALALRGIPAVVDYYRRPQPACLNLNPEGTKFYQIL